MGRDSTTIGAKGAVTAARQAETQLGGLVEALRALEKVPLSPATQSELSRVSSALDKASIESVLTRALDELNAVPNSRVDTDELAKVPHGVVVLFRVAANQAKRNAPESKKIIDRFMSDHPGIEITASDRPWGAGDRFAIRGTKGDRLAFLADARWPKLQEALNDIYLAEHLPGYPSDRPPRKIADASGHVFG